MTSGETATKRKAARPLMRVIETEHSPLSGLSR